MKPVRPANTLAGFGSSPRKCQDLPSYSLVRSTRCNNLEQPFGSHPESFKMPSISYRMRALQTKLLAIRLGSGALILPKEVKRIHMRFARRIEGGHLGPR